MVMGQCPPLGLRWTGCMVCAALSCYTSAPVRSPIRRTYGIVLDAGSSRTTAYVYEWPAEKENNTGVVSQTFKCNVKGPGISSYGNNPREIAEPINDCMNKVKEKIPSHLHSSTPVYLGATAGMRLLRSQNESAASEVLESIQNYFTSQPFDFRGAKIITGQAEGVYGWITANYLKGNFLEVWLGIAWVHPHGAETTGALDLGGASTQISFIPEESTEASDSMLQVQLYGYPYKVYTHSFQCYGRDEAEKTLLASILRVQSRIENPCYPQNYETALTMKHLYGSLCTEKLITENYNASQLVTVVGTGDPTLCREAVSVLFNFTSCRDKKDCSFNGIHQPKIKGNFVVCFIYLLLIVLLCLFIWWLWLSYCFSANYIYYLLIHGYKFNAENWPQIHFQKEVGNSSIAWSLGYMLNLTNMIPAESDRIWFPMNPSLFAGLLFFFTAVVLLCQAVLLKSSSYNTSLTCSRSHKCSVFSCSSVTLNSFLQGFISPIT
uniref:Ectonucleoside triphosphate diphosphohydrolase 3 n=1 Tax=Varanus komodoensis TaxID=61221 RepID=A0A8D2IXY1_VARKO